MENTNKVSRDGVIDQNILRVSNEYANMFNWNYTTFIRNYSLITDTWAALWGQMIANRRSVKAVFLTIEKDDYKQPPTNHVHLAIATSKPIEPDQLSDKITKAINLKKKHIGNIEPIRGKEETLRYISKHIRKNDRFNNTYYNLFINKSKN